MNEDHYVFDPSVVLAIICDDVSALDIFPFQTHPFSFANHHFAVVAGDNNALFQQVLAFACKVAVDVSYIVGFVPLDASTAAVFAVPEKQDVA